MKKFIVWYQLTRGYMIPFVHPPDTVITWASVEQSRMTITARDPDAACHLVGSRWATANGYAIIAGPHYTTNDETLQQSPALGLAEIPLYDLAFLDNGTPPVSLLPLNFKVRTCKEQA